MQSTCNVTKGSDMSSRLLEVMKNVTCFCFVPIIWKVQQSTRLSRKLEMMDSCSCDDAPLELAMKNKENG